MDKKENRYRIMKNNICGYMSSEKTTVYNYILFDTEQKIRSEIELTPEQAKDFAKLYDFDPIAPVNALFDGMFDFINHSLDYFSRIRKNTL